MKPSTGLWFSDPPPTFTESEEEALKARLASSAAGQSRLLCVRMIVPDISETSIELGLAAALVANYLLLEAGSSRILKLFKFLSAGAEFDDLERYAALNFSRALLSGGFAALKNYPTWLKSLQTDPAGKGAEYAYDDIASFLESCSLDAATERALSVAEAYMAIANSDKVVRPSIVQVQVPTELTGKIQVGDLERIIRFEQIANFGPVVVRSSGERKEVFVDLDLSSPQDFKRVFTGAIERFRDQDFLRVGRTRRAGLVGTVTR